MSPAVVGLNACWLVPGVVGGSERSTIETLRALPDAVAARGDDVRHVLFTRRAVVAAYPEVVERFETVVIDPPGGRPARVAAESTRLAVAARRRHLGVLHHLGGTMPTVRSVPGVLTVHDLQPLDLPENFGRVKRAYLRSALPRSVRAARLVLTPSEYVRRAIIARFDVDPDRVRAVPHGVALDWAADAASPGAQAALRVSYELPARWFTFPAITYRHKNHEVLVRAFAAVRRRRDDVALVLTGGEGPEEAALAELVAELGLAGAVRRTGRVPTADLAALVAGATALVFPSLYEGFGLPVLEAMAAGVPVLAARATALPEVVGDAGLLLDPHRPEAWRAAMMQVMDDDELRRELVARGRDRAAARTWAATAAGVAAAHADAAGDRHGDGDGRP